MQINKTNNNKKGVQRYSCFLNEINNMLKINICIKLHDVFVVVVCKSVFILLVLHLYPFSNKVKLNYPYITMFAKVMENLWWEWRLEKWFMWSNLQGKIILHVNSINSSSWLAISDASSLIINIFFHTRLINFLLLSIKMFIYLFNK
jgi:hypothetical protein